MALHPNFPESPYAILDPSIRWFPADESLRETSMEKLMQGRTSIVIAHRLATIRKADRILVFEKGVLKQSGSHAELMREDGIYRELVNIQTAGRGDPSVDPGDNAEIAANNGNGEATGAVA